MTTEILGDTDVDVLDVVAPYKDTDDPNARTHIINPPDNPHISRGFPDMMAEEVVRIARANRVEIVALCGYKFIPEHNPDKHEVCDACLKIAGEIMRSLGE